MDAPNKVNPAITALIVVALIAASTTAVIVIKNNESDPTTQTTTSQNTPEPTTSPADSSDTASASEYTDGTYSAVGTYITPGGRESVGVTVTLENDIIVTTELDERASRGDSITYQRKFASGYKAQVVGKNINEVELSRVAGSSLTSGGFNDAIEQIRKDASA